MQWDDVGKCYPDGYLFEDGVKFIVDSFFKHVKSDESVVCCFELYEDRKQLNWLAVTAKYIIFIQDDRQRTKSCNDNIKWVLPKTRMNPVVVNDKLGTVSLGPFKGWLYSKKWSRDWGGDSEGLRRRISECT